MADSGRAQPRSTSQNFCCQCPCPHDGQVFSWGKNSHGQLGLGKKFPSQASPQRVRSLEGIPLAQVTAGGAHSFALSLSGTSFGWGSNNAGKLALGGNKVPVQSYKPQSVGVLKTLGVIYVSCGYEHTAVLTKPEISLIPRFSNRMGKYSHLETIAVDSWDTAPLLRRGVRNLERTEGLVSQIVEDLADVQVNHIFAGTYANFVTTYQVRSQPLLRDTGGTLGSSSFTWEPEKPGEDECHACRPQLTRQLSF
ncbi:hypothetical protein J1605_010748 [Eschrichtius robustus]|uniref:Uncharacterized protein n=1 Tax=Eschrichtius robustus TaxID=9764 RepID=A0AB34GQP5_ESCRO|nr:hypothetical protein J1605_010748 [Eschrichtius robustus]